MMHRTPFRILARETRLSRLSNLPSVLLYPLRTIRATDWIPVTAIGRTEPTVQTMCLCKAALTTTPSIQWIIGKQDSMNSASSAIISLTLVALKHSNGSDVTVWQIWNRFMVQMEAVILYRFKTHQVVHLRRQIYSVVSVRSGLKAKLV